MNSSTIQILSYIIDVVHTLLFLVPSFVSVKIVCQKHKLNNLIKLSFGIGTAYILFGFMMFPDNDYIRMPIGAFVCSLIGFNYKRICHGKSFSGLLFPSVFFFNLTTFTGNSITENLIMILYAAIGGLYLIGLMDGKEETKADFFIIQEKKYCIFSAVLFSFCRLILLILQIFC